MNEKNQPNIQSRDTLTTASEDRDKFVVFVHSSNVFTIKVLISTNNSHHTHPNQKHNTIHKWMTWTKRNEMKRNERTKKKVYKQQNDRTNHNRAWVTRNLRKKKKKIRRLKIGKIEERMRVRERKDEKEKQFVMFAAFHFDELQFCSIRCCRCRCVDEWADLSTEKTEKKEPK